MLGSEMLGSLLLRLPLQLLLRLLQLPGGCAPCFTKHLAQIHTQTLLFLFAAIYSLLITK